MKLNEVDKRYFFEINDFFVLLFVLVFDISCV